MGTETISPLRQRMIEDMAARASSGGIRREATSTAAAVRGIPEALARHGDSRRCPPLPAASDRERAEHLQSQPHHDRGEVPVPRHAAAARSRRRGLSPQGAAEAAAGHEPGRGQAAAGDGGQAQGARHAQRSAMAAACAPARWFASRSSDIDSAQSIIRVVQAKGRKDRHVMLPPEMLALLREWWAARPTRYDAGRAAAQERWLFPGRQAGPADDDAPAQPPVPRDGAGSRDQESGDAAFAAPQLCDAPARARDRYSRDPGAARPCQARCDGTLHARCHRP